MRRYSANYIFPVSNPPIKNGIIEVDDEGKIVSIINPGSSFKEIHSTEFHNGIIIPGFVNAHCHLELSHLLGKIPQKQGIATFIKGVTEERMKFQDSTQKPIANAINELELTGTVAVGDICNTADTLSLKVKSGLFYHNFVEVFGINPNNAEKVFDFAITTKKEFEVNYPSSTSITPHSTYSLSKNLWNRVSAEINDSKMPVSIHFAESVPEYEFLKTGSGPIFDRYKFLNIPFETPSGLSPLDVIFNNVDSNNDVLLIHNTFASIDELLQINGHYRKVTFVTCPESNIYIENSLPVLAEMHKAGLRIAIGTDSLASASTLSMLHHIILLLDNFKEISFADILKWSTLNGAEALNIESIFGTLEVGKNPGLNLITDFDFNSMKPTLKSRVKRLV